MIINDEEKYLVQSWNGREKREEGWEMAQDERCVILEAKWRGKRKKRGKEEQDVVREGVDVEEDDTVLGEKWNAIKKEENDEEQVEQDEVLEWEVEKDGMNKR